MYAGGSLQEEYLSEHLMTSSPKAGMKNLHRGDSLPKIEQPITGKSVIVIECYKVMQRLQCRHWHRRDGPLFVSLRNSWLKISNNGLHRPKICFIRWMVDMTTGTAVLLFARSSEHLRCSLIHRLQNCLGRLCSVHHREPCHPKKHS